MTKEQQFMTQDGPRTDAPLTVDVSTDNFMQEVMSPSATQLVLLDFWAPWCGPCKGLTPILEKTVKEACGAVRLAKVNIDENPQLAQQLRVQSVPTVFAFFNQQIVDGFMGALPESQIREWIATLIKQTGAKATDSDTMDFESELKRAQECIETDDFVSALTLFSSLLEKRPADANAFAGLLRSLVALGESQKASELINNAPATLANDKALIPVKTAIDLALQAGQTGGHEPSHLLARLKENEDDHQARFDLALTYYAQNNVELAIDALLEIVKRDRKWQDESARTQLVKIFEALGHTHPLTVEGRKKLSTLLFA